jgi:hypothetical protein
MIAAGSRPISAQKRSSACAAADHVVDVAARDVPDVGVLGDHAQRRGRPAPDHYRRMWSLGGFRVAERAGELVIRAVEVERFRLGPQPLDDRAGLGEAAHRLCGVARRAGRAPRIRAGRRRRSAVSPRLCRTRAAHRRRCRRSLHPREHRRRPEAIARDEQSEAERCSMRPPKSSSLGRRSAGARHCDKGWRGDGHDLPPLQPACGPVDECVRAYLMDEGRPATVDPGDLSP